MDHSTKMTVYESTSQVLVTWNEGEREDVTWIIRIRWHHTYVVRHDDSGRNSVTRIQLGVIATIEKMSRVALLNNNTTNVNSPTHGSGLDNV